MNFKAWINSLTSKQLMALGHQHGCPNWKAPLRQLRAFLVKSKSAKAQYKEFYG